MAGYHLGLIANGSDVHRSLPSNSDEDMLAETLVALIRSFQSVSMAAHKKNCSRWSLSEAHKRSINSHLMTEVMENTSTQGGFATHTLRLGHCVAPTAFNVRKRK